VSRSIRWLSSCVICVSFGVPVQELEQLRRLLRRELLSLEARLGERFPVLRVRVREGLVAVGLPGLSEQDERRCVGGLQAEGEVQEDEGVDVEAGETDGIDGDPEGHHDRLRNQE